MSDFTATLDPKDYSRMMTALSDLSKFERENIIIYGLKEGLTPIAKLGRMNYTAAGLRIRKGKLYKSIGVTIIKKDLKGYAGFKRPDGAAGHLLDRGTAIRRTYKAYTDRLGRRYPAGMNRGRVRASMYWTRAVDAERNKATNTLMESVEKTIENIIRRNSR